ncbi:MAG: hypothetical protein IPM74_02260 [Crocinitomicaceae bacterium]|nr:hypothetical protein [Crocinitomicaceae bacterium]MBK8924740.1 hypothetical protein [Crocinitomicaceae bacterium]
MEKYDKTINGILAGLILPILGYIVSFFVKTRGTDIDFTGYWEYTLRGEQQQDILIFCLIPNMFFFYFTNFRWNAYNMTKGLVGVTLILGLALFLITM